MKIPYLEQTLRAALKEDIDKGDLTTQILVPASSRSQAQIIAKQDCILCGQGVAKKVFQIVDPKIRYTTLIRDGVKVKKGNAIARISGHTRSLLTGERVSLNFLSHLSGISTKTYNWIKKVKPLRTKIMDTRKTIPGLRHLQKYAVRCGGGVNHRKNLREMIMIKDNHREMQTPAISPEDIIKKVRKKTRKPIIMEVDNLSQLGSALKAKPEIILLDNMSLRQMRQAVQRVKKMKKNRPLLEASGGIQYNNIVSIAKTGVDRISIGALTHTVEPIDMSMEMVSS